MVLEAVDIQGFDGPQVMDGRFASVDDTPSSLENSKSIYSLYQQYQLESKESSLNVKKTCLRSGYACGSLKGYPSVEVVAQMWSFGRGESTR